MMQDDAIRANWVNPKNLKCWLCLLTCGMMGKAQKANCTKWDKWIGADKWPEDLPEQPPDYEYEIKCGLSSCIVCRFFCTCCDFDALFVSNSFTSRLCKRRTWYRHMPVGPYAYNLEDDVWDPKELKTAGEKRAEAAAAPQTFMVAVPAGAAPGMMLQVPTPTGAMMAVQVPAGAAPGTQFEVAMPVTQQPQPAATPQPAPAAPQVAVPQQPAVPQPAGQNFEIRLA